MNLKRIFGAVLTVLGIGGLIYAAIIFVNSSGESHNLKILSISVILGFLFFITGINLVKSTKDES